MTTRAPLVLTVQALVAALSLGACVPRRKASPPQGSTPEPTSVTQATDGATVAFHWHTKSVLNLEGQRYLEGAIFAARKNKDVSDASRLASLGYPGGFGLKVAAHPAVNGSLGNILECVVVRKGTDWSQRSTGAGTWEDAIRSAAPVLKLPQGTSGEKTGAATHAMIRDTSVVQFETSKPISFTKPWDGSDLSQTEKGASLSALDGGDVCGALAGFSNRRGLLLAVFASESTDPSLLASLHRANAHEAFGKTLSSLGVRDAASLGQAQLAESVSRILGETLSAPLSASDFDRALGKLLNDPSSPDFPLADVERVLRAQGLLESAKAFEDRSALVHELVTTFQKRLAVDVSSFSAAREVMARIKKVLDAASFNAK